MTSSFHSLPGMRTGPMRKVDFQRLVDKLSGLETLDLSVAAPPPTAHFQLGQSDDACFLPLTSGVSYGNAWQVGARGNGLQTELRLPHQHGVVLILELCRTAHSVRADQPVLLRVNDEEWPLEIDPHNLKFHRQSWYLPHFYLHEGMNFISLHRAPNAQTEVLVRALAIMRFEIERQKRGNWCWAAVSNSLLSFFDATNERTQCDIVQECFGLTKGYETDVNCCQHTRHKDCNRTFKLVDALDILGVSSMRCNYPLSLDEIRHQINQGVPVGVRIGWRGGGGHFVVITAVGPPAPQGDNFTWLRVADPKDPAASYITYRTLKQRYKGEGEWTHSYLLERERKLRS